MVGSPSSDVPTGSTGPSPCRSSRGSSSWVEGSAPRRQQGRNRGKPHVDLAADGSVNPAGPRGEVPRTGLLEPADGRPSPGRSARTRHGQQPPGSGWPTCTSVGSCGVKASSLSPASHLRRMTHRCRTLHVLRNHHPWPRADRPDHACEWTEGNQEDDPMTRVDA